MMIGQLQKGLPFPSFRAALYPAILRSTTPMDALHSMDNCPGILSGERLVVAHTHWAANRMDVR
jgi:hypothetical protein